MGTRQTTEQEQHSAAHKWIGRILRHATSLAIILGILGTVARPWAEDFITTTVNKEKFATQKSLDEISAKTQVLEQKIESIQEDLNSQKLSQARTERDLDIIKRLQTEQRGDTKRILERLGVAR